MKLKTEGIMAISALNIVLRKSKIKAGIVCGLLLWGCSGTQQVLRLPYYNTPDFTPVWEKTKDAHSINAFTCTDQYGKTITEKSLDGKITVVSFFFTSCGGICPQITNNLKKANHHFAENDHVQLLSYSVTPEIDTPERLHWYVQKNELDDRNWHLLTGNKSEIYALARQSYFAEEEMGFTKDSTDFLHTEHVLLIDPQKHIRGVYNGTIALDAERLIDDIALLLQE
jgi:protein SCO1/2